MMTAHGDDDGDGDGDGDGEYGGDDDDDGDDGEDDDGDGDDDGDDDLFVFNTCRSVDCLCMTNTRHLRATPHSRTKIARLPWAKIARFPCDEDSRFPWANPQHREPMYMCCTH